MSVRAGLRRHAVVIAIAVVACGLAVAFAATTVRFGGRLVLPVDEAYQQLACAKQLGHGAVFGGACADAPSVAWPALLAVPAFILGDYAFVALVFGLGAALFAVACAGAAAVAARVGAGGAGAIAGLAALAIAPFAFTALAGLDVALTSALFVVVVGRIARLEQLGPPSRSLGFAIAVFALASPEARVVAAVIIGGAIVIHTRADRTHAALRWLLPAIPAALWLVLGSPVALPVAADLEGLKAEGVPFAWAFAALWLVGAVRVVLWARAQERRWVAVVLVGAPVIYLLAAMRWGGSLAPAFPLFAVAAGCAVAPIASPRIPAWSRFAMPGAAALVLAITAIAPLRASLLLFAQDATDLDRRTAKLAVRARQLSASVIGAHDAGTAAFFSGTRVIDLDHGADGPGERFERVERLDADLAPELLISSPAALGTDELFGETFAFATMGPKIAPRRSWTRGDLSLFEARWDHVRTAERPLTQHVRWHVVDRVDIADRDDEAAHDHVGSAGSLVHREAGAHGLVVDGGRTMREERFTINVDPAKPVRLVLRTGGARQYPDHEVIAAAKLQINSTPLEVPAPRGAIIELALELRAPSTPFEIVVVADRPYRSFHWFALQPD